MRKRRDGLFQRKANGIWYFSYTHPITGIRIRKSTKTTIKPKAKQKFEQEKADAWDRDNLKTPVAWTVREVIEWAWRTEWSKRTNADKYQFFTSMKSFLGALGGKVAAKLTVQEIEDYVELRKKQPVYVRRKEGLIPTSRLVSRAAINKEIGYARSAFNLAIKKDTMLKINPFSKVKIFDESESQRHRNATPAERKMLLERSKGLLRDVLQFAFDTGLRKGEIENLKWVDISSENMKIRVISRKGRLQKIHVRWVPIMADALAALERRPQLSEWVFCNEKGEKIPRDGIIHTGFPRLVKRLGIKDLRFHDIRHTFATAYYKLMKFNLRAVQLVLGHLKLSTTAIYLNFSTEDLMPEGGRLYPEVSPKLVSVKNEGLPKPQQIVDNQRRSACSAG